MRLMFMNQQINKLKQIEALWCFTMMDYAERFTTKFSVGITVPFPFRELLQFFVPDPQNFPNRKKKKSIIICIEIL